MKKSGRQLAIILELQRKRQVTAQELASTFEASVRTIYRDIEMLCEAGVPILGLPGTGYSLLEGYFLPPISFTTGEALAVLFGTDFIEYRFDNHISRSAQSLRNKVEAILPLSIRREADKIKKSMLVLKKDELDFEKSNLEIIRKAILENRKIQFKHHKRYSNTGETCETFRTAAPFGLVFIEKDWILIAQCELRNDIRHFKISRMSMISPLEEYFDWPQGFNLEDYYPKDNRHITIKAIFTFEVMDKVKESNYYYIDSFSKQEDGFHVTFRVHQPEEILQWILSWGSDVVIIEPLSFKEYVKDEIENTLKRY